MSVTKVTGMMSTGTKGGDIPSASTLVIDTDGDYFDITGTTGITAMTVDAGRRFTLHFDGALTLTHGSSLYLPGATNFTTEANDCLSFIATAANTVRCTGYALKDGGSPVVAAGGAWTLIQSQTASSSSTIDFTSGITDTYDVYVFVGTELLLNTGGGYDMLFSTNGGSSYESSGYNWSAHSIDTAAHIGVISDSASFINIDNMEVASDNLEAFQIYLYYPSNASYRKICHGTVVCMDTGDTTLLTHFVAGHSTTSAINGVRFDAAGGAATITSGRISLYGISHS